MKGALDASSTFSIFVPFFFEYRIYFQQSETGRSNGSAFFHMEMAFQWAITTGNYCQP